MTVAFQTSSVGSFPYFFALLLSAGSLFTYLVGAVVSRYSLKRQGRTARAFNLGLPPARNSETLFAVSLAAAQTTFSTVFVTFLTSAGTFGFHFLYCPLAFAAGNWIMLRVYERVEQQGHIDQSGLSGLVPYLVYRFTRNRLIGYCLVLVCVLPIVSLLALELRYGIGLLDHLIDRAFHPLIFGSLGSTAVYKQIHTPFLSLLLVFACFMVPLLGYVFIGGFRAVITSDVWQYRIMVTTLSLACLSVFALVIVHRHSLKWSQLSHPTRADLIAFYSGVTLINFFTPLCLATTWQRLRAFREQSTNFPIAIRRATVKVAYLWTMLILIGIGLQLVLTDPPSSLPGLLDRVAGLGSWFQLFVFPLLIVAGLSGMYSSSDTCISSLLYLTETSRAWEQSSFHDDMPLRKHYYWTMLALFVLTFGMYVFVKRPAENPVQIALKLFGNAIVLAPTVVLLTVLEADASEIEARARSFHIGASIVLGFAAYWWMNAMAPEWATAAGLIAAAIPACLLVLRERQAASRPLPGQRMAEEEKHV